jgi:uncharacterized phiE125 gp8 family phage protein
MTRTQPLSPDEQERIREDFAAMGIAVPVAPAEAFAQRTLTPPLLVPWAWPHGSHSVLITPPTEEPVTVAQAKLLAGLDWLDGDPRDDLMKVWIAAARSKVEQDTGLALLTQTRDLYFSSTALATYGYVPLANQVFPVQSVLETQSVVGRTVKHFARPVFSVHGPALVPHADFSGSSGIVRLIVGWQTAADLLAAAPLLTWAVGVLAAHYATLGRDLASLETADGAQVIPFGYEDAIGPHRLIWVT